MQYLLLICDDETRYLSLPPAERESVSGEYRDLIGDMAQKGQYKGGNQLQPVRTATTVRVRNGKAQTTDGPFAETREQLGGFYMVDAANLDEAIAIAARIPSARIGSIEVRPVMVFSSEGMPADGQPAAATA